MRRLALAVSIAVIGVVTCPYPAFSINSIVIESKIASSLVPCTLGLYLTNDEELWRIAFIFETRVLDGNAYYDIVSRDMVWDYTQNGRLNHSPLGPSYHLLLPSIVRNVYPDPAQIQTCSGPLSSTYDQAGLAVGGTPPDGFILVSIIGVDPSATTAMYLEQGADPPGIPSLRFVFPHITGAGRFIVDTCCVGPANHTYIGAAYNPAAPFNFTPGIVTTCACDCQADPACDGEVNMADVVKVVDVAFSDATETPDPNSLCLYDPTDVDCDGITGVLDVVKLIGVSFRNADPSTVFCHPCQ